MKKYQLLLLAALALVFSGCKDGKEASGYKLFFGGARVKKMMIMALAAVVFAVSCNTMPANEGSPGSVVDEGKFAKPSFQMMSNVILHGPVSVADSRLKVFIPAGTNDWANGVEFEPEATDFTITVRLNFKPKMHALQAGIMLYNPSAGQYNAIKLTRGFFGDNNQFQLAECVVADGLLSGGRGVRDTVAGNISWLRLIKDGKNVGAYFSEDGENFSYVAIGRTNINVETILLFGSSWAERATATAYFEEFSIDYENHTVWTP